MNKEPKFKVGDKVRVVADGTDLGNFGCNKTIYEGYIDTINDVIVHEHIETEYELSGVPEAGWVRESFIELVEPDEQQSPISEYFKEILVERLCERITKKITIGYASTGPLAYLISKLNEEELIHFYKEYL